jgi:hypothetical protein
MGFLHAGECGRPAVIGHQVRGHQLEPGIVHTAATYRSTHLLLAIR